MPVSLSSNVVGTEGLRHVLALSLAGKREDLLAYGRSSTTWDPRSRSGIERGRRRTACSPIPIPPPRSGSRSRPTGDFGLSARVAVGDGQVEDLTHVVTVSASRSEAAEPSPSLRAPASPATRTGPAPSWERAQWRSRGLRWSPAAANTSGRAPPSIRPGCRSGALRAARGRRRRAGSRPAGPPHLRDVQSRRVPPSARGCRG